MLNTFQQNPHAMLPKATHDEASRQEFVKSYKQFIQQSVLPGLGPVFKNRASKRYENEHGKTPTDRRDVRVAMVKDPYFQHYAAAQRISQELMWDATVDSVDRQLEDLNARAKALSAKSKAQLRIPENFEVPKYISSLDIHCMPGGYIREVTKDDVSVGAVYDRGVFMYSMGYCGPNIDDMGRSVCNYIKRNLKGFAPKRILDMGCTVGHSTLPFKEMFPDAEVWGIDVGARASATRTRARPALGLDVNFAQMNAEKTEFEDASFDLIVSHILLHETSYKAMPRIFKECYRLLKPGGVMIHADLPPFDKMDVLTQFILDNETWYNNEPFWGAMREMDQFKLETDAGFRREDSKFTTAPMAILEFAAQHAEGYSADAATEVADREFTAGEFAPGGGWEVFIAQKQEAA